MNNTKITLFSKDFILVVIGQIISLFGNQILRFALPLYLLNQTNSAAYKPYYFLWNTGCLSACRSGKYSCSGKQ